MTTSPRSAPLAAALLLAVASACGGSTTDLDVDGDLPLGRTDAARAPDGSTPPDLRVTPDGAPSDGAAQPDAAAPDAAPPPDAAPLVDLGPPGHDLKPAPHPVGCITSVSPGAHVFTCDGLAFDVSVPPQCATTACGLVVDVHGASMSAQMEDANTALRALGISYGYVVVQPNAKPAPPLSSWSEADDAKVVAVMKLALEAFALDPKRVHVTGFSQGGMMTFRLVCKHADLIASAAPAAGSACFRNGQLPSREVPLLYLHGTRDALVPFQLDAVPQRDAIVAAWKLGPEQVVSTDGSHRWTRRTSPTGTPFEFVQHDWSAQAQLIRGHCFPGSKDLLGGAPGQVFGFACLPPNAVTWGEAVMKFFVANPRK